MLANLTGDHEEGELACYGCDEQFGGCACGGVIHCGYEETFVPKVDVNGVPIKKDGKYIPERKVVLTLECDRCDEYEVQ